MFSYRRHTLAPERTVEKVLENITAGIPAQTSDLDELIKQFETQYQPYFTNEAYNQAVQLRQFTAFHNQTPDFEGSINISSPEFETLDSSLGDISLYGTFQVNFTPVDGTSFTQNWNIQVRLVQEDGRWLIRYMRLKFNKAGELSLIHILSCPSKTYGMLFVSALPLPYLQRWCCRPESGSLAF